MSRITFNVGGTEYEVSQSLLDQYPDCMLRAITSSADWNGSVEDAEAKKIFIDRNGTRFQYVYWIACETLE
jgi:uncharacterized membrane protein YebE (DUF533 family)